MRIAPRRRRWSSRRAAVRVPALGAAGLVRAPPAQPPSAAHESPSYEPTHRSTRGSPAARARGCRRLAGGPGLLGVCHGVRPRCTARPRFAATRPTFATAQPHHPHPGEICLSVLQFRVSSYLFNSASLFIRASVHLWNYLAT